MKRLARITGNHGEHDEVAGVRAATDQGIEGEFAGLDAKISGFHDAELTRGGNDN